jgi:hypothetical protein
MPKTPKISTKTPKNQVKNTPNTQNYAKTPQIMPKIGPKPSKTPKNMSKTPKIHPKNTTNRDSDSSHCLIPRCHNHIGRCFDRKHWLGRQNVVLKCGSGAVVVVCFMVI